MHSSSKSRGRGIVCKKTDDASNDKDGSGNKPKHPKNNGNKEKDSNGSQTRFRQESNQGNFGQTNKGKQHNKKLNTLGGYAGRVMVGDKRQPICIPAGMSNVVVRRTQDKLPRGSYMVESTDDDNLPCGVSVNHIYVSPSKAKQVSVILLNTNSYNVWIQQPLYAATIWDVELKEWDYKPILIKDEESDTVEIKLQQVPPEDLREEILSNATEVDPETSTTSDKKGSQEKDEKPSFGIRLDTRSPDFDFKKS